MVEDIGLVHWRCKNVYLRRAFVLEGDSINLFVRTCEFTNCIVNFISFMYYGTKWTIVQVELL